VGDLVNLDEILGKFEGTANHDELIRRFKGFVPVGPTPIQELVKLLGEQVNIKGIAPSELPGQAMPVAMYNAYHCIFNQELQLTPDRMLFYVFQILRDKKSSRYYASEDVIDDFIYVIFEKHTGYIWSNSQWLFLELVFAKGVSQHELATEGLQFLSLFSYFENMHLYSDPQSLAHDHCLIFDNVEIIRGK
jgi:hypothetical protein